MKSYFYHEINHIFYTTLIGSYHPVWFSEGMATYLMGDYKLDIKNWKRFFKSVKNPEKYLYYRYIKKKYYKNSEKFYALSFLVYRHLYKNYGQKKLIDLLVNFSKNPTNSNFNNLFKKYFNKSEREIVKEMSWDLE